MEMFQDFIQSIGENKMDKYFGSDDIHTYVGLHIFFTCCPTLSDSKLIIILKAHTAQKSLGSSSSLLHVGAF